MADWSNYWRSPDRPLEAMHAHFERHVYHRHSHETYSFGFTEEGAQSFTCRGAAHTSAAGMVMAFNPDDPHDGHATNGAGFTYRMLHLGPELLADVLKDAAGRPVGLPLFADPVVADRRLAGRLRGLHEALLGEATPLRRDELLDSVVLDLVGHASHRVPGTRMPAGFPAGPARSDRATAQVVREMLHDGDDGGISAGDLAAAAGRSRFAVYRSFHATYGMAPSDYQRQLRLRAARRLLAEGRSAAEVAAVTGFTDQSHLTRWFTRCFGVTPGAYRRAVSDPVS
ncbi:AraC family transcriptional regulator [Sphaerisporangium fuscum]|uniref:AraC family transcriptional regulator n=1 Tax=Sphaerisporangium fuscum TaxID=2835868 RepID=UPI002029A190|nr:AraC family transcriptional regulator [Sphaerisporangium fuscum]